VVLHNFRVWGSRNRVFNSNYSYGIRPILYTTAYAVQRAIVRQLHAHSTRQAPTKTMIEA